MSTHPIGAPGSIARFLDDHARDPESLAWPAAWCVFTYRGLRDKPVTERGPLFVGAGPTKEAAELVRAAAAREHSWAVVVDVRTYGCKVAGAFEAPQAGEAPRSGE